MSKKGWTFYPARQSKPFALSPLRTRKAPIHARQAMVAQYSMTAKQIEEQTPVLKRLRALLRRPIP